MQTPEWYMSIPVEQAANCLRYAGQSNLSDMRKLVAVCEAAGDKSRAEMVNRYIDRIESGLQKEA